MYDSERQIFDKRVDTLKKQAKEILDDPLRVYDLAGKRLAIVCAQLRDHFVENTCRIAIIGDPNRGKTTFSYTCSKLISMYGVPTQYVDLDLYTQSGRAISNQVSWGERPKREVVPLEEINKSIEDFGSSGPGIVIADFPGKIDNPHQKKRLKKADFAIILAKNWEEIRKWSKLCSESGTGSRWLSTINEKGLDVSQDPLSPAIIGLNRRTISSPALLATATSVVTEAANVTGGKYDKQFCFTEPELVVLEEVLDFHFSIEHI